MEYASKQKDSKQSATPLNQEEFKQKDILFKMMRESKSFEKHPTHKALYDALMLSLIKDEDDMDKAAAVISSTHLKRQHDDEDEDPSAGPNRGKGTKRRRTKNLSHPRSHPHQKTYLKVIMDVADNTANDDEFNDVD
ncbi:hypothetical protein Tco_1176446 [Tanacetum coccineum]